MAPECFDASKHTVTHKSDIFSLGVLIWEMLVRKQPWMGQSFVRVMYLVTVSKERLPIPPESRCPRQLRKLLEECWDTDPQRRPSAAVLPLDAVAGAGSLQVQTASCGLHVLPQAAGVVPAAAPARLAAANTAATKQ